MTFNELYEKMLSRGEKLADVALGRMMDIVEEETGKWPDWNDRAPKWVIEQCIGKGTTRSD